MQPGWAEETFKKQNNLYKLKILISSVDQNLSSKLSQNLKI